MLATMNLKAGETLGPYEIVTLIGAGGMGEVYRARDSRLERDVAIKILPERLSQIPEAISRFEREARALGVLTHPNVVTLHDFGTEGNITFTVSELLEGEDLSARLGRAPMAWNETIHIALAVCSGLAAAHVKGITHRDLKPENIFLTNYGIPKILDFGLARFASGEVEESTDEGETVPLETQVGRVLGTPRYMSPEQARGYPPPDTRSDIFSFGCVLYEMTTGRKAFDAPSAPDLIAMILRDPPEPFGELASEVPPEIKGIILKCLEKDRTKRFANAGDLEIVLKKLVSNSSDPNSSRTGAGVSDSASGSSSGVKPTNGHQSLAVLPLSNLSGDPEQEFFADGMTDALISNLAKIHALKVISRRSIMRYKNSEKPLPEIASELGVDLILEGTVLRGGDRVRISTQLIEAVSDRHIWSESYERPLSDILSLQGEVSKAVAEGIKIQLTPEEKEQLEVKESVDPEAHEAYMKGLQILHSGVSGQGLVALQHFKKAELTMPRSAELQAWMGFCYGFLGQGGFMNAEEAQGEARTCAHRALEFNPKSGSTQLIVAYIKQNFDWDWVEAERAYRYAIDLAPGNPDAHHFLSRHLQVRGRHEEAVAEIKKAQELDPLSLIIRSSTAAIYRSARRLDDALEVCLKTLEEAPNFAAILSVLGGVYRMMGRHEESVETFRKAFEASGRQPSFQSIFIHALTAAGRNEEAKAELAAMEARTGEPVVLDRHLAVAYVGLRPDDDVLDRLEAAYDRRSEVIFTLKHEQYWDTVRDHPRFQKLLERSKLA